MCWMFSNLFMAGNHDFSCLFPSTACFPSLSHCWFLCLCVLLSCPYLWSCLCVDCFFEKQKNKKTEGVAISKESQRHKLWMCFDSRDLGWNEVPFSRSSWLHMSGQGYSVGVPVEDSRNPLSGLPKGEPQLPISVLTGRGSGGLPASFRWWFPLWIGFVQAVVGALMSLASKVLCFTAPKENVTLGRKGKRDDASPSWDNPSLSQTMTKSSHESRRPSVKEASEGWRKLSCAWEMMGPNSRSSFLWPCDLEKSFHFIVYWSRWATGANDLIYDPLHEMWIFDLFPCFIVGGIVSWENAAHAVGR